MELESDNAESEAIRILRGLGFKEEMMSSPFTSLSGGWRSRCRLATALIVQTDLLILDEPSNFMVRLLIDIQRGWYIGSPIDLVAREIP
jgi:ATPase subunit of ABC transporter with duplicated ATPase domains